MGNYVFFRNCVSFSQEEVYANGGLRDMVDRAWPITRKTFTKWVDLENLRDVEVSLGYEDHPKRGMTMAQDCHVSYHKSKLFGKRVYYFVHSAIEYIFIPPEDRGT